MFAPLLLPACEPEGHWATPAQVCEWYDEAAAEYADLWTDTGSTQYPAGTTVWCGTNLEECDDPGNIRMLNREFLVYTYQVKGCGSGESSGGGSLTTDVKWGMPSSKVSIDCGEAGEAYYWPCFIAKP
ncbi:MAG: hypothetical protein ACOZNI_17120 [Myxococcota bacterium]